MDKQDRGRKKDQLEAHDLPGTNQAGKGPGAAEENDQANKPDGGNARPEDELEEHSLPGTNQAGKSIAQVKKR